MEYTGTEVKGTGIETTQSIISDMIMLESINNRAFMSHIIEGTVTKELLQSAGLYRKYKWCIDCNDAGFIDYINRTAFI